MKSLDEYEQAVQGSDDDTLRDCIDGATLSVQEALLIEDLLSVLMVADILKIFLYTRTDDSLVQHRALKVNLSALIRHASQKAILNAFMVQLFS